MDEDAAFEAALDGPAESIAADAVVSGSCSVEEPLLGRLELLAATGGLLVAPFPGGAITDLAEPAPLFAALVELGRAKDEGLVDLAEAGTLGVPCRGGSLGPLPFVAARLEPALLVVGAPASELPVEFFGAACDGGWLGALEFVALRAEPALLVVGASASGLPVNFLGAAGGSGKRRGSAD